MPEIVPTPLAPVTMFQPQYSDYEQLDLGPIFADEASAADWVKATVQAQGLAGHSYYVNNWSVVDVPVYLAPAAFIAEKGPEGYGASPIKQIS